MPNEALRHSAKLVILKQIKTPFDRYSYIRFFQKIGDVLPKAASRLKILMDLE
jgi:hypothetical protein